MTYRIRYRQSGSDTQGEVVVEANSPNEAMVKFQCTRHDPRSGMPARGVVTSVSATDPADSLVW